MNLDVSSLFLRRFFFLFLFRRAILGFSYMNFFPILLFFAIVFKTAGNLNRSIRFPWEDASLELPLFPIGQYFLQITLTLYIVSQEDNSILFSYWIYLITSNDTMFTDNSLTIINHFEIATMQDRIGFYTSLKDILAGLFKDLI